MSRDSSTPLKRNVVSDTNGDITGETLLTFGIKAQKDTLKITELNNVVFTPTAAGYLIPETAYLYDGSTLLGTATPATDTGVTNFTDMDFSISKDTTKVLTIKVDDSLTNGAGTVTKTDSADNAMTQGDKYVVTVTGKITGTAYIVAEKSSGATVDDSDISGTAASNEAYVYTKGPIFTLSSVLTSSTASSDSASSTMSATFNVQVTAKGGDIYVAQSDAFTVKKALSNVLGTTSGISTTYTKPSGIGEEGDDAGSGEDVSYYKISEDTTVTFAVASTYLLNSTAGNYDLRITDINWASTLAGVGETADNVATFDSNYMSNDMKSDVKFLQ